MKTARPPLPQGPAAPDRPARKITYTLTWDNGDEVVAVLESHWSTQDVPIHWTGSLTRLDAAPTRCDDGILNLYLERQVQHTGGKLTVECSGGEWLLKD